MENAPKFWSWVHNRGGVAKWQSVDFSDLGASWSSPVLDPEGVPTKPPHWKCGLNSVPIVCTNPDDIRVVTDKEVERFHIAIRRGGQGLSVKLTDASSSKLRKKLAKWGEQCNDMASYYFDYAEQDAIITIPDKIITLTEWAAAFPEIAAKAKAEGVIVRGETKDSV